ncbi:MAG: N-acetylglucosamine-6-phosphate deacetylase [Prolixibacteraceae bacterium]|jgi:N-acetylglucosamine-6-phosphate deacetylase|nr:N-acetylglucosamine-6-phosphate deacetylase [Prolixibacteraceae bacterium]
MNTENKRLKIINGKIITPYRIIENHDLWVENGYIVGIEPEKKLFGRAQTVDAEGRYVAPGFIDMHTHGAGGHDFMDGTLEAFLGATEMHARHGTTSLVPTTLTSSMEELKHTLSLFREASEKNEKGAQMLGLHLEGPYFSLKQCGAQDPKFIHDPDPAEYVPIVQGSKDIIRWSAAPELSGAMEFGRFMARHGILPSIAHTDAIYEEVAEAFENGFTHITHLYSAMSGVTRRNAFRYAGVIESAFLIDEMTVEIIADGVHLPKSLLQLIYKIKGADKIALITDSMRAAGMPEGPSILGSLTAGQEIIVEDGVAKLLDRTAFAGSVATADRLVRTMINLAGINLIEAIRMITSTPARICRISEQKGSIAAGKQADLVIFDEEINVKTTIVKGEIIYSQ